jgi:hypothetical protein
MIITEYGFVLTYIQYLFWMVAFWGLMGRIASIVLIVQIALNVDGLAMFVLLALTSAGLYANTKTWFPPFKDWFGKIRKDESNYPS